MGIDFGRARDDVERQNLKTVERWLELYNAGDYEAFAKGCYVPDNRVWFTSAGWDVASGHEKYIALGKSLFAAQPGRRISIEHVHPCHEVVVLEGTYHDLARPDFESKWCSILTFREDGMIVEERSHLDPAAAM